MAGTSSGGRLEFEFTSSRAGPAQRIDPAAPFRMLVIGDFSGRGSRGVVESLEGRRAVAVDVDQLDAVIAHLKCSIEIGAGDGTKITVPVVRMDSLNPDHLVASVELLKALRTLRMALNNPATSEAAAAQLQALVGAPESGGSTEAPPQAGADQGGSDFERLMGGTAPAHPKEPRVDIDRLIASVVKEHIVASPDPRLQQLSALVDSAIFAQLGKILHDGAFQQVEAAWRGVQMLVSRLNLDEQLRLFVLDASRAELVADLSQEDLSKTALYKLLVEQTVNTPGANRWAVVGVDQAFGAGRDDAALLARLGTVVQQAGAALVTGATGEQTGCPGLDVGADPNQWNAAVDLSWWQKVRGMPVAKSIAVTWPRILMRLPYGPRSEPTEIGYDESGGTRAPHSALLWGSAMWGTLGALGQAFLEEQWDMRPGGLIEIEDLPMYSYTEQGEKQVQAVAEAYLTDRAAARIADRGIIPVMSLKNTNTARFAGFSSIALPPAPLSGPWG